MLDEDVRRLSWPDCRNARDLGGLPTESGGRIRTGALVRADNLTRLTPAGIAAVHRLGVRRIIDLRSADEVAARWRSPRRKPHWPRRLGMSHPKLTPAAISATRTLATSRSTVAQNGGHQRVLAT